MVIIGVYYLKKKKKTDFKREKSRIEDTRNTISIDDEEFPCIFTEEGVSTDKTNHDRVAIATEKPRFSVCFHESRGVGKAGKLVARETETGLYRRD